MPDAAETAKRWLLSILQLNVSSCVDRSGTNGHVSFAIGTRTLCESTRVPNWKSVPNWYCILLHRGRGPQKLACSRPFIPVAEMLYRVHRLPYRCL